jgi:hypothetical protein
MQTPVAVKLKDVPKDILIQAFSKAMENTPFDDVLHRLMVAMQLNWYSKPQDAREVARRLFNSIVDYYIRGNKKDRCKITSGCIAVEVLCFPSNVQCRITFDPCFTGLGFIHTDN